MADELSPADAARALAAQRRQVAHTCPVCGTAFTAITTRRYCSRACQQRAYRRQHEARAAAPPATVEDR